MGSTPKVETADRYSSFREWSNLSIMTRENVGESTEPCCTPRNMGKTVEEVKLTLTMASRFP